MKALRRRRMIVLVFVLLIGAVMLFMEENNYQQVVQQSSGQVEGTSSGEAVDALGEIPVKGRAPKTGYSRSQFGDGWSTVRGCDTRNIILYRDLTEKVVDSNCLVQSGSLNDPYTGKTILFKRGSETSQLVQIDHVVALSNAWQTGAQQLSRDERIELANDPLELLAVDGPANQQKGDGDAATWLPSNKSFRCQYVARQVAVKQKYRLWVTASEKEAILRVLGTCPGQKLPAR